MAGIQGRDASLRYLCISRGEVSTRFNEADADAVLHGLPVRKPPTYLRQRNYPGLFWSATTESFLIYESLLELDCLWLKDFDPAVEWIATQPFEMSGWCAGRSRRHVPDIMLQMKSGRARVVDVKPEQRLDDPDTAAVFRWTGEVCAERGWDYEVWSGELVNTMANIRFLGSARRSELVDSALAALILNVFRDGQTVADLLDAVSGGDTDRSLARTALIHLMWCQALVCDLTRPVTTLTVLRPGKGSWDECNS